MTRERHSFQELMPQSRTFKFRIEPVDDLWRAGLYLLRFSHSSKTTENALDTELSDPTGGVHGYTCAEDDYPVHNQHRYHSDYSSSSESPSVTSSDLDYRHGKR
ncbi:hypothetical protein EYF80_062503 [Liparis tanakae]|uniref:Uncharacterized protein n=1 Tax=Liparis tanakae TaxID=230148 RepID=A0A4Z2EF29_9TELE|nr:hypothetical protein EYF80_062503 [Liparis tanakae]